MSWLFETSAEREAREQVHRAKVRKARERLEEKETERKARRDAVGRVAWGLWKAG